MIAKSDFFKISFFNYRFSLHLPQVNDSMENKIKPAMPSGTRDFLPQQVMKRNFLFNQIKSVFEQYGFQPIDTPVLENLATLTGKYGDEGDQLLFKILNQGDFLKDVSAENLASKDSKKVQTQITDRGLRYDLTVPLARYVVMHQNDLTFPFKRYHIAPVWRGDRPQKGRYREFYQCDADIIGSDSLFNEIELVNLFITVFKKINLANITIRISNRKILTGLAEVIGATDFFNSLVIIIDKIDKIGVDKAIDELIAKGLTTDQVEKIKKYLTFSGSNAATLAFLEDFFSNSEIGKKGVEELAFVANKADENFVKIDLTLARGLNYYTGFIVEVVSNEVGIGSIASGGRYENLTEMFGGKNMSGVGISFGVERIYDILEELNKWSAQILAGVEILVVPMQENLQEFSFELVTNLRNNDIGAELFLGNVKKNKQMNYAESKGIRHIIEIGEAEKDKGVFRIKNRITKEEQFLNQNELIQHFTK